MMIETLVTFGVTLAVFVGALSLALFIVWLLCEVAMYVDRNRNR